MIEIALGVAAAAFLLSVLALAKAKPPEQELGTDECVHIWEPWEHFRYHDVYGEDNRELPVRRYSVQRRKCLSCGFTEFNKSKL